jgi:phosphoglycerate dehydrogenase-like enzyme
MSVNVLVLGPVADSYAARLREAFPALSVFPAAMIDVAGIAPSDVDVLVTFGIGDAFLRRATRLAWIQALTTGVDHFLRCPSLRLETLLTSGRGIHGPAMRETVAFLMLALSREAPRLLRQQAARAWDRSRPWSLLSGKTVVIVGVGVSGTALGQTMKSFGMTVVGVSHTPRDIDGFDRVLPAGNLREAAAEADYLVDVLPAAPGNRGVIGTDVFAAMKSSAFFINVGRGETVDEAALIAALRENRIAGAGLDVFAEEPLPADSPLWDLANVIVLPHIAGFFREYEDYAMPIILDNMRLFLDGRHGDMRNLVAH